MKKHLFDLASDDFKAHPVWREMLEVEGDGELMFEPMRRLPVYDTKSYLVGIPAKLANGDEIWARFSGVYPDDARKTSVSIKATFEKDGKWFQLERYPDGPRAKSHRPEDLAQFLGLALDDVFPISYDLRPHIFGDDAVLVGNIEKTPDQMFTKQERQAIRWEGGPYIPKAILARYPAGSRLPFMVKEENFKDQPVWGLTDVDPDIHTAFAYPLEVPVKDKTGRQYMVGSSVTLANGRILFARFMNVGPGRDRWRRVDVMVENAWIGLSLPHGRMRDRAKYLLESLGVDFTEVFPVSYDLRKYFPPGASGLHGTIE